MIAFLFASLLASQASSFPISTNCELPKNSFADRVIVTVGAWDAKLGLQNVTSILMVDNKEVPPLSAGCQFQNVPGRRGFRCPHGDRNFRYYVYPAFDDSNQPATGLTKKVAILRSDANGASDHLETTACAVR